MRNIQKASKIANVPVQIGWEPFLLNPQIPEEGEDIWEYLTRKIGPQAKRMLSSPNSGINKLAREAGITFIMERNIYPTVMPHALMEHFKEKIGNEKANELMDIMFKNYFELGHNINNVEVLKDMTKTILDNETDLVESAMTAMQDNALKQQVFSKD